MTRVIIIEDEDAASQRLTEMLKSISSEIKVIKVLDSVADSIDYLSGNTNYDLILIDIHLSDGTSFEIFRHVNIQKPVIFTTAYDEYAIKAFKQYAVDYLLKPVKKDLLDLAIKKYERFYRPNLPDYSKLSDKPTQEKKWMIKIGSNIRTINYDEVAYYFTIEKITYLFTFDNKKYPIDVTLEHIETNITNHNYFRINRQYIIHQNAIDKMSTHTKSRVRIILKPTGEEVIVSTERSPQFKKWLVA